MTDTQFMELTDSIRVESLRLPSYIPDGESFKIAVGLEFQGKVYETEMLAYDHGNFTLVDKSAPFAKTDGLEALIAGRYPDDVERIFSGIAVNVDRFVCEQSERSLEAEKAEIERLELEEATALADEIAIQKVSIEPYGDGHKGIVTFAWGADLHALQFIASERPIRASYAVVGFIDEERSDLRGILGGGRFTELVFQQLEDRLSGYVEENFTDFSNLRYETFELAGRDSLDKADIDAIALVLAPRGGKPADDIRSALADLTSDSEPVLGLSKVDGSWRIDQGFSAGQIRDKLFSVTGHEMKGFDRVKSMLSGGLSFGDRRV
ncbi:hypothetical protein [Salinicola sp. MIT1003]|uniref:hypothetical protein n=1 Tax=Salinicola sp. MIT1003 TaxID=1882734 RepID=UPI0008DD8084|nr:hypothetical protein [Salinicola sp. MIT1003]OHZ03002.1 hypothetical protein BC443_15035 [Salinicola sp. MIT1003]